MDKKRMKRFGEGPSPTAAHQHVDSKQITFQFS